MIYCTTWDGHEDMLKLYEEWTGSFPEAYDYAGLNCHLIIAKDTENRYLVGAAQLIVINDRVWHRCWGLVENVYVLKGYRHRGVGKKIMEFIEEQAGALGCAFIKLTSAFDKAEAHKLYQSLGYIEGLSFKKACG